LIHKKTELPIFAQSMHIAINTRFLLKGKLEGIGWFTHETVRRMILSHPEHQFTLIFDRPFEQEFIYASNVRGFVVSPPARHPLLMWWYYNIGIPKLLRKIKPDVFLSTDGFASLATKIPQCVVIHDLAFVHYPKYLKKSASIYLRHYTPKFIAKAKSIIAVSTYTKQDIIDVYGTSAEKINIVFNSANDLFKPLDYEKRKVIKEKYTQGVDYFLYVGSLHPRKNIVRLLKAFHLFKRNTTSNMKLILIGRLAWLTDEIVNELGHHAYKEDILRLDYLNADVISEITAAAYASVYPSLFEGFGIPVLEAIKCNVPVITSNTSSMPEVGGKACILIDPKDELSIADAMMQIYNDENFRNKLIQECPAQASLFSWNISAEALFQNVLKCVVRK
jgi:glycosyltransferase involved in cell wall biosynthesis